MAPLVTLLTDFGTRDAYVAAMQARILTGAPATRFVHLTHDVPPQNVDAASYVLATVCHEFPPGTFHLVVVDPGVGTNRRPVIACTSDQTFVGPDNGVFARALEGRDVTAYVIEPDRWRPPAAVSATFHGRDVFAPAVAQLASGRDASELGTKIAALLPGRTRSWRARDFVIEAAIVWIDRFGNCITDVPAERLPPVPRVEAARWQTVGLTRTYADAPTGTVVALVGSQGTLEVAVAQGRADERLGLRLGDVVRIEAEDGGPW